MKVIYLDQLHWIKLSQAFYGRGGDTETRSILEALYQARTSGRACFPLSFAHYIETTKQRAPDRRQRLAVFMLELSGGKTIAPPTAVWRYEIEVALSHCFPGRVVPEPFQLLGTGLAHAAADRNLNIPLQWPPGAEAMPAPLRADIERYYRAEAELSLLSGVLQVGEPLDMWPVTSLTVPRQFKASLEPWAGATSQYSPDEFERELYITNFSEIDGLLRKALARYKISSDEFKLLGECRRRAFLDDMPWQRAEMHLKRQWAKNADLRPQDSDLIDWGFLSMAVSYCDIVVTEKQKANLFSRGFNTRATIIAQLSRLPKLVA